MKAAKIIFGILAIILSVFFFAFPGWAEVAWIYVIAIVAGLAGIVGIIDYIVNHRKRKLAGVEVAAGGLSLGASIALVIIALLNVFDGTLLPTVIVFFLIAFILIRGVTLLVSAFTYRAFNTGLRVLNIILGILLIILACAFLGGILFATAFIMGMLGILTGISLVFFGISAITSACEA